VAWCWQDWYGGVWIDGFSFFLEWDRWIILGGRRRAEQSLRCWNEVNGGSSERTDKAMFSSLQNFYQIYGTWRIKYR